MGAQRRALAFLSRKALIAWGLSLQAALELVAGIMVGFYLDTKTGKAPLFLILGLIAGMAAAIRDLIALARLTQEKDNGKGE
jgi:F0F1-type ATP synthase assembly protein I